MILTIKRHGRSKRDVRNLVAHLNKQVGQQSRVIRIGNVPLSAADDVMAYMTTMRDASHATVAMHHIAISPRNHLTDEQRDEAVSRILAAIDAQDHAYVLWHHSDKARASDDVADDHYHLVVAHIGPDGRALKDSWSYVRMEAAARSLEVDFHEPVTPSRLTKSVIKELRRVGRADVAEMLDIPPSPPASAMSSRTRSRAERQGIDLPEAQAAVRVAWTASDGPLAFRAALAEAGIEIATGSRRNVFVLVKDGVEIGALDRVVREKRAAVAARMQEERNDNETQASQRWGGDLPRSYRRPPILGKSTAIAGVVAGEPERRQAWAARRGDGFIERDRNDPREARRNPDSTRRRVIKTAAVLAIGRDGIFRKLRYAAEAVASGKRSRKSRYHHAREQAAANSLSKTDVAALRSAAAKLAAGGNLSHSEFRSLGEVGMKFLKPSHKPDYKTGLLAEIAPAGFDVSAFSSDIHMIKKPTQGNPTTRVMMRDHGWIEFDKSNRTVKTWGPFGRAQVLAQALASSIGVEVDHLAKTASVGSDAAALKVAKTSEDAIKSLVRWWALRGYSANEAPDGCWVNAGRARILDTGDRLEIHGGLTDQAVAATLLKAKEEWGGGVYLDGHWTQAEQDHIWLAAMRAGVEVENCRPSLLIQKAWDREREASAKSVRTISAVRMEIVEAQRLLDAAKGDVEQAKKLPGNLQAFLAIYLDDDQRRELAARPVAEVVPHLSRFRELGADELKSHMAPAEPKITFADPEEDKADRHSENAHAPK